MKVPIKLKSKGIVCGTYSSGKSTLMRHFAKVFQRYWIYSPRIGSFPNETTDFELAWNNFKTTGQGVYRPLGKGTNFETFCQRAMLCANALVILDECGSLISYHSWADEFDILVRNAHARNVGLLMGGHVLSDFPTIAKECNYLIMFRANSTQALNAVENFTTPEVRETVANLAPYHWYFWQNEPPYLRGIMPPVPL